MYLDVFALHITCLAASGGMCISLSISLIEEPSGVWRRAGAAASLIAGVILLMVAMTS